MMEQTMYHQILRIGVVVTAFVLLFDSGYVVEDSKLISQNTQSYLANVIGVSAAIPANELNVITAELTAKETALNEREAAIEAREISLNRNPAAPDTDHSTFILSGILFIMLVLIVLNYGLDYARLRRIEELAHVQGA